MGWGLRSLQSLSFLSPLRHGVGVAPTELLELPPSLEEVTPKGMGEGEDGLHLRPGSKPGQVSAPDRIPPEETSLWTMRDSGT